MLRHRIRSLSAAALALTGTAVLAPSAQAAKPAPGWRVTHHFSPPRPVLHGVAASDTRSAWVVGSTTLGPSSSTPASYHWNGKRWTADGITANQVSFLTLVSTSGPTNTWAFGYKIAGNLSRSLHWDGHTWATADLPKVGGTPPYLFSSVTLGPKDTWAFGSTAGTPYIAHFTGKRWKQSAAPLKSQPGGVTNAVALSGKNIWALVVYQVSYDVLHYDGRSWTIVKTPANFGPGDGGLVVRSKNDIWLSGARLATPTQPFQPGAMHYNGKKWSFVAVNTRGREALRSVTDDGQGGLWALAAQHPSELWHDVNGHWSKVTLANNADITGLSHIPGTSTTFGIGSDGSGTAVFVTGRF